MEADLSSVARFALNLRALLCFVWSTTVESSFGKTVSDFVVLDRLGSGIVL